MAEYQAAQQLLEGVVRESSTQLGAQHPRTIAAQLALAAAIVDWDAYERAQPILDAVEQPLRRLPPSGDLVESLRLKAVLYVRMGRFDQGEAAARAAIEVAESLPESASLRERMVAQHTLAQALLDARLPGHLEPARKAYELASRLASGRVTVDVLTERSLYALALTVEGEPARALVELQALLPPMIELLGPQHQQVQRAHGRIGFAAEALGEPQAAIDGWRRAQEIELAWSNGQPTGRSAFYGFGVARGFATARRYDEAERETRLAVAALRAAPTPGQHDVRMSDFTLAWALIDSGKLGEAEAALTRLSAPRSSAREMKPRPSTHCAACAAPRGGTKRRSSSQRRSRHGSPRSHSACVPSPTPSSATCSSQRGARPTPWRACRAHALCWRPCSRRCRRTEPTC